MGAISLDPYRVQVINNTTLLKEIPKETSVNGIILPETKQSGKNFIAQGEVVASATAVTDCYGKPLYDISLSPGDIVLYDNRSIQQRIQWGGSMYFLIRAEDVFGTINRTANIGKANDR